MAQTQRSIAQAKSPSIGERVGGLDWSAIVANLDEHGCATQPLLTPEECTALSESYDSDELFRSRIVRGTVLGVANTNISSIRWRRSSPRCAIRFIRLWLRLPIAETRPSASI